MALKTLAAVGTTDASTGITRFTNRPPGALGMATLDANGKPVYLGQAALVTPGNGAGVGTPRDPYDVPTAKALQVIADYQAAQGPVVEIDTAYYGCVFTDDYTQSGDEFKYECSPSRPINTGGATVWKWRRYLEAGV